MRFSCPKRWNFEFCVRLYSLPDMWLWLRRLVVWVIMIGASAAYWIELTPMLHTKRQHEYAVLIFGFLFLVLAATLGFVLRLLPTKSDRGNSRP